MQLFSFSDISSDVFESALQVSVDKLAHFQLHFL